MFSLTYLWETGWQWGRSAWNQEGGTETWGQRWEDGSKTTEWEGFLWFQQKRFGRKTYYQEENLSGEVLQKGRAWDFVFMHLDLHMAEAPGLDTELRSLAELFLNLRDLNFYWLTWIDSESDLEQYQDQCPHWIGDLNWDCFWTVWTLYCDQSGGRCVNLTGDMLNYRWLRCRDC